MVGIACEMHKKKKKKKTQFLFNSISKRVSIQLLALCQGKICPSRRFYPPRLTTRSPPYSWVRQRHRRLREEWPRDTNHKVIALALCKIQNYANSMMTKYPFPSRATRPSLRSGLYALISRPPFGSLAPRGKTFNKITAPCLVNHSVFILIGTNASPLPMLSTLV